MAYSEIHGVARENGLVDTDFDTNPISIASNQYNEVSYLIEYKAKTKADALTYTIEYSLDNLTWFRIAEVQAPVLAAGADCVDGTQRCEILYTSTSTDIERFMTPTFDIGGRFIRLLLKETAASTHGTAKAYYFLNREIA